MGTEAKDVRGRRGHVPARPVVQMKGLEGWTVNSLRNDVWHPMAGLHTLRIWLACIIQCNLTQACQQQALESKWKGLFVR